VIYSIQPTIIARQAVRAAKRLHIPIISHSHTLPDLFIPGAPQFIQKLVKRIVASMYRKYDGLIYPTEFLKKRWADCHFKVPVVVIGNGVDTTIFHPGEKKKSDMFSLLYVGRLDPGKNISLLLDALHLLHTKKKLNADFHCTIVG
jgi:glycosyltransferase involved in cell wall biosynthesis